MNYDIIFDISTYLLFGVVWSLYWESMGYKEYPMNNAKRLRYILTWPIGTFIWVVGFTIGFINHMIQFFKNK